MHPIKQIPKIGLGTWKLRDDECTGVVRRAIDLGYTHIDTATGYGNHRAIGNAVKHYDRSTLFITSKINRHDLCDAQGNQIRSARAVYQEICADLGVDYIDLLLLHTQDVPLSALTELHGICPLGVSNFESAQLRKAINLGIPLHVNQIELHVPLVKEGFATFHAIPEVKNNYLMPPHELEAVIDLCRKNNIALVAHRPLAKGVLVNDLRLTALGKKYGKTAGQVALRWLVQQDFVVIPKARSTEHLRENRDIFDFALTQEEMSLLARAL